MKLKQPRLYLAFLDALLLALAFYLAYSVRFEFALPANDSILVGANYALQFKLLLLWIVGTHVLLYWVFQLYRGMLRYAGIFELKIILGASAVHFVIWSSFNLFLDTQTQFFSLPQRQLANGAVEVLRIPWGILFAYSCFAIVATSFVRLARRMFMESSARSDMAEAPATLIVGAGDVADGILRNIMRGGNLTFRPVCVVALLPNRVGLRLHGIPVVATIEKMPQVIADQNIRKVLIALDNPTTETLRTVVAACENAKVSFEIVPSLADIADGKVEISKLREVEIEDLLGRDPVKMDIAPEKNYIRGEVVLITGAGGSIGSELSRQVARAGAAKILLLGKGENSIFDISQEIRHRFPDVQVESVIADVRDTARIEAVFINYAPAIVFHAAAHKHVPLMESAPDEAVKNNVLGTANVVSFADRYATKRFILVSTDKAVRPTSVMGATKRLAETIVFSMGARSSCVFQAVRFGNVLGSRGSVIPIFHRQIGAGGPVTVTHPDVERYFMTIPEAVSLVLQAGARNEQGSLYLLEMGKPVKIVDLARNMIALSGLRPDVDIKIEFTGLRPGEKIREELLTDEEGAMKTEVGKLRLARSTDAVEWTQLEEQLAELDRLAELGRQEEIIKVLRGLVDDYAPANRPPATWRALPSNMPSTETALAEAMRGAIVTDSAFPTPPDPFPLPDFGQELRADDRMRIPIVRDLEFEGRAETPSAPVPKPPEMILGIAPSLPAAPTLAPGIVPFMKPQKFSEPDLFEAVPPPEPVIDLPPTPQLHRAPTTEKVITPEFQGESETQTQTDLPFIPSGISAETETDFDFEVAAKTSLPVVGEGPHEPVDYAISAETLDSIPKEVFGEEPVLDIFEEVVAVESPLPENPTPDEPLEMISPLPEPIATAETQRQGTLILMRVLPTTDAATLELLVQQLKVTAGDAGTLVCLLPADSAVDLSADQPAIRLGEQPEGAIIGEALEYQPDAEMLLIMTSEVLLDAGAVTTLRAAIQDGASLAYADYRESKDGDVEEKTLVDHEGCPHERFEFGPVIAYSIAAIEAAGGVRADLNFAWEYDLQLRLMEGGDFAHVVAPLYTRFATVVADPGGKRVYSPGGGPLGGFSYVFYPPDVEREVTAVFEEALRRRSAWLDSPTAEVPHGDRNYFILASVVIPVLNRVKYIGNAIAKVVAGNFQDFEVIIVDNGSTDGTLDVVADWSQRDARIRLIHGKGGSIASALNEGIRAAAGKYICQLDSDDEYAPETLERMIGHLETQPKCGLAISYYRLMDEAGVPIDDVAPITHSGYSRNQILRRDGAGAVRIFPRIVLEEFGLYDEEHYGNFGEDYDMVLKVGEKYDVDRVHDVLYFYRRHSDNTDVTRDPLMKFQNKNRARQEALRRRREQNQQLGGL